MNRKQTPDPQDPYRMNYYPPGAIPAGYAVAAADKPGLYAASPYATLPLATQPRLPPGMQHYAAATQQYAMVSQPSPYSQHAAAAYYTTPAGYAAATVPLSSLQTIPTTTQQAAYLAAQYPAGVAMQRAVIGPTPVTAAGYGGSPLYAASTYTGMPGMPGQPSRPTYGIAPVGYTTNTLPNSPTYPGASSYGPPY